ncbi:MAG: hypothetical protein ABGZ53_36350 [Fuerstiella sp.]
MGNLLKGQTPDWGLTLVEKDRWKFWCWLAEKTKTRIVDDDGLNCSALMRFERPRRRSTACPLKANQDVKMWMPTREFAVSLYRRYHPGHHIVATRQTSGFGCEARPGT